MTYQSTKWVIRHWNFDFNYNSRDR